MARAIRGMVSISASARGQVARRRTQGVKSSSVDRLVETAAAMFNRFGIHATGIDRILAESGTARMTLYNHFGSKEGLIREVLRRDSAAWFDRLDRAIADAGPAPADKIAIYFDVLRVWFSQKDFKGCGFINAVGEAAIDDECVRPIAKAHREANVAYVRDLLGPRFEDADRLADTIVMIADGATVDVMVTGDREIVERARLAATDLIDLMIKREPASEAHRSRPVEKKRMPKPKRPVR